MSIQNEVAVDGGGKQYGTKLTVQGSAALAACILDGVKLEITEIAAGDGGGAYYEPLSEQTALAHEVWRGEILACEKNPLSPNMLDIKGVIPSDAGGFVVREIGVFDAAGTLIGVCNTPDMEKMTFASGAGGKLDLIMHLLVTDADAVQVIVKPSLDTISLEDARKLVEDGLRDAEARLNASLTEKVQPALDDAAEALQKAADTESAVQAADSKAQSALSAANAASSLITCGTSDLTAGSSSLTTGAVYLMYK